MAKETEEEDRELENDEDEDEDEDEDDEADEGEEEEVLKEDLLEEIAEVLGENIEGATEVDVPEDGDGAIVITMNDESRWKLVLRRIA